MADALLRWPVLVAPGLQQMLQPVGGSPPRVLQRARIFPAATQGTISCVGVSAAAQSRSHIVNCYTVLVAAAHSCSRGGGVQLAADLACPHIMWCGAAVQSTTHVPQQK